jgi:hypothetical protein
MIENEQGVRWVLTTHPRWRHSGGVDRATGITSGDGTISMQQHLGRGEAEVTTGMGD